MKENTVKLIMESLKEAVINTIIVLPDSKFKELYPALASDPYFEKRKENLLSERQQRMFCYHTKEKEYQVRHRKRLKQRVSFKQFQNLFCAKIAD